MGRRARKSSARHDPVQVWRRSVRRALRDYIAEHGTIPGLACFVSRGRDPKNVEMLRLELLPSRRAVRELIVAEIARFDSRFAAYGGLMGAGQWFGLLVCDAQEALTDGAPASPVDGLGGWEEGTFKLGDEFGFVQRALERAAMSGGATTGGIT